MIIPFLIASSSIFLAFKTLLISAHIDELYADTDKSSTAKYQLIITANQYTGWT